MPHTAWGSHVCDTTPPVLDKQHSLFCCIALPLLECSIPLKMPSAFRFAVQHVIHSSEDWVSDSADGGWITRIDGLAKLLNNEGLSQ